MVARFAAFESPGVRRMHQAARRPHLKRGRDMRVHAATACALILFLGIGPGHSAQALTPQQELMKTCNAQAGSQKLAGDARKSFMSECLSGKSPAELTKQQELMKTCNAQAGSQKLAGDARKSFMSDCLSGKSPAELTKQQELMKTCNTQASAKALKGDARKQFMSACLKG